LSEGTHRPPRKSLSPRLIVRTPTTSFNLHNWCRMVLTEGPQWAESNDIRWFSSHASVVLGLYLHLNQDTLICFPSQETIARLTCRTRRTVVRAVRDLVTLGFIETKKRGRGLQYRPVTPVHLSLNGCETRDPTRDVGTDQKGSSFPTELKENSKRKRPDSHFTPSASDCLPSADPLHDDEEPAGPPRRWITRAHKLEPLLSLEDQAKIRHKLKMDPDEDVTFQTIIELGPDAFEPLWNAHRPPLGPPNG